MLVVMHAGATAEELARVVRFVEEHGFQVYISEGTERILVGVIGNGRRMDPGNLESLPGVERVVRILHPFKLAGRDMHPEPTRVRVGDLVFGGPEVVIIAGPCSVESREQLRETAYAVKEAGARALRGGAFKPRTSPYSFQGLGVKGLELLKEVSEETGLPVVTEVLSPEDVSLVARFADVLQIGSRNMQNFPLLQAAGRSGKPVLLKRGLSARIEEFLLAAEYILLEGNPNVLLCERGIRTFETATRNTFDVNAIPLLKELSHLPVLADPSHGTGRWSLVAPVARAAVAAGADGLIVEVHPRPEEALSDGAQSLRPERFQELVRQVAAVAAAVDRYVALPSQVHR